MAKKSFSIHSDFYSELCNLTPEQRGDILLALVNSAMDIEIPELDPVCAVLFRLMNAQMTRISEANSANSKGHGAPKGNQNARKNTSETNELNETNEEEENKRNKPSVSVTVTNTNTQDKDPVCLSGEPAQNSPAGKMPDCPHDEIVRLYHETLPELPQVKDWGPQRQEFLRARWRSAPERQSLDWWRAYFYGVRNMDWLMGRKDGRDGRPFFATLEWLVRPANFTKVVEGVYLNRETVGKLSEPTPRTYAEAVALSERKKQGSRTEFIDAEFQPLGGDIA